MNNCHATKLSGVCKWMFGLLFGCMILFLMMVGYATSQATSAGTIVDKAENRLATGEERDKYIVKTLDEIKTEQISQRKMLSEAISKSRR